MIAKAGVSVALKKLESMLPSARTTDLYKQMADDAAYECEGFIKKMVERMGGDPDVAIARLADSVNEEEAAAIIGRLLPEAVFSATKDRRRLMAAAMAGTFSPDFRIEEKSRITRAIAQLEPSDVVVLRSVKGFGLAGPEVVTRNFQERVRNRELSLTALEAAGCIEEIVEPARRDSRGEVHRPERRKNELTHLGSMTLQFIAEWEPAAEQLHGPPE